VNNRPDGGNDEGLNMSGGLNMEPIEELLGIGKSDQTEIADSFAVQSFDSNAPTNPDDHSVLLSETSQQTSTGTDQATNSGDQSTTTRAGFERPDELEQYQCMRLNEGIHFRTDWRWLRAWLAAEQLDRPMPQTDDDQVRRVAECLVCAGANSDKVFLATLTEAYELSRAPALATVLQARLLAREDARSIATRMNVNAAVVDLFHDVFFAVRPHLDCPSLIRHCAFSAEFHRHQHIPEFADLMKLSAYQEGPAALEDLLWYQQTPRPPLPKKLRSLTDEQVELVGRWYSIHRFVAVCKFVPKTQQQRLQYMAIIMRQRS
jgi:hypothetical protein